MDYEQIKKIADMLSEVYTEVQNLKQKAEEIDKRLLEIGKELK